MKAYECLCGINTGTTGMKTKKGKFYKPAKFVPKGEVVMLEPDDPKTKKWLKVKAIAAAGDGVLPKAMKR